MKNILKQLSVSIALGTSLLFSTVLPAQAQTGNASDVTGAIITTSDIVGGAFAPTSSSQDSAAVAAALSQAVSIISTQLAQGTLPIAVPGVAVASIPVAVQQTLLAVLTGTGNAAGIEGAIAAGITDQSLAASLQGLFADGTVSPTNLVATVQAYNAFVDASSGEALSNPSPAILTVQSVLAALVSVTSAAQ